MATTIDESKVVDAVRINLDEIGLNDDTFDGSADETELDTIIKQKIPLAYAFVVSKADAGLIGAEMVTKETASGGTVDADKVCTKAATLTTGTTVLRFLYAQGSTIDHIVYEPYWWNMPEYATLSCRSTTGSKERPKVGIRPDASTNKHVIEVYGCSGSATVCYVGEKTASGGKVLSDTLYAAFIYYITSLTLLTLHENKHAEDMLGQAMALMGVDTSKAYKQ